MDGITTGTTKEYDWMRSFSRKSVVTGIFGAALMVSGAICPSTAQAKLDRGFRLPDTRQTICYDNDSEITCPDDEHKQDDFWGQDAHWIKNIPAYTNNRNGTVSDTVTMLLWEYGDSQNNDRLRTLQKAEEYCAHLNDDDPNATPPLPLGGIGGGTRPWRLPTRTELMSLLVIDKSVNHIDGVFDFSGSHETKYWYKAEYGTSSGSVNFATGYAEPPPASTSVFSVRCVRKGIPKQFLTQDSPLASFSVTSTNESDDITDDNPDQDAGDEIALLAPDLKPVVIDGRFVDPFDGTLRDLQTGFRWTRNEAEEGKMTWQKALEYCKNFVDESGRKNYRLPNEKELATIIDNEEARGLHDAFYSRNSADIAEWTATTLDWDPRVDNYAYMVDFPAKKTWYALKGEVHYVRCVKAGK